MADDAGAFDQVAMGDNDPFGQSGGAGGVDNTADIFAGASILYIFVGISSGHPIQFRFPDKKVANYCKDC